MSHAGAAEPTVPFESAAELKRTHATLLEALDRRLDPDAGAAALSAAFAEIEQDVRVFLARGTATGVFLQDIGERTACQVLLDYWTSSLVQAGLAVPAARLTAFDATQLPDLKNTPCPYVGLAAFEQRDFFYGRESDAQILLAQVVKEPLVIVLGSSGSGKSSLVMAGVIPALAEPTAPATLRIVPPITPGLDVFQRLAGAIGRVRQDTLHDMAAGSVSRWDTPVHLRNLLGGLDAPATLITIDQFEEVFTLCDKASRDALVANLADVLGCGRHHRILLTMREEFRSRLVELQPLGPYLDSAWYTMRPMNAEQLRRAVQEPASRVNLQFQPGIVEDLVNSVLGQPAALPLLQFTLHALWDARDRNRITREVYDKVGDPLRALETSANNFYEGLAQETKDEMKRLLLALVRVDDLLEAYRQPVAKSRLLEAGKANTEDVLTLLADPKINFIRITPADREGDAIIEVKHESLVRNWPRLVGWIDEKRHERRERLALMEAARRWDEGGRPREGLLTGWQLEGAARLTDLSGLLRKFVDESKKAVTEEARRKVARLAAVSVAMAVLTLISLLVAFQWHNRTDASTRQMKRGLTLLLATKAQLALSEGSLPASKAALIAVASVMQSSELKESPPVEVGAVLAAAVPRIPEARPSLRAGGPFSKLARSAKGPWTAVATAQGAIVVFGTDDKPAYQFAGPPNPRGLSLSPDGRYLAASGTEKQPVIQVWDLASSGTPINPVRLRCESPDGPAVFSPDNRLLLASCDSQLLQWSRQEWDRGRDGVRSSYGTTLAPVWTVTFDDQGNRIAIGGEDAESTVDYVHVYNRQSPASPVTFSMGEPDITCVAFLPGPDEQIVVGDDSGAVRLFRLGSPTAPPISLAHGKPIVTARPSQDGRLLLTVAQDGMVRIWDRSGRLYLTTSLGIPVTQAEFDWDTHLITVGGGSEDVRRWILWNSQDWTLLPWQPTMSFQRMPRIAGDRVFLGGSAANPLNALATVTQDGRVAQVELDAVASAARLVALSGDGTLAAAIGQFGATGGGREQVALFDQQSGDAPNRYVARWWEAPPLGPSNIVPRVGSILRFSSDAKRLLAAVWYGKTLTARVYHVVDGRGTEGTTVIGDDPMNIFRVMQVTQDGRVLLRNGAGTLVIWSVGADKPTPIGAGMGEGTRVAEAVQSHDGRMLAVAEQNAAGGPHASDSTVRLLQWPSLSPIRSWLHQGSVLRLAFSPTDKQLLSAAGDGTLRVWDSATGAEAARIASSEPPINVAFSMDGRRLIAVGRTWVQWRQWILGDLAAEACRRAEQSLTQQEWSAYVTGDYGTVGENYRCACRNLPCPDGRQP